MTKLATFLGDDFGAMTTDWVTITAGILLLGMAVVFALFNTGIDSVVSNSNETLAGTGPKIIVQSDYGYTGADDGSTDVDTAPCTGFCE